MLTPTDPAGLTISPAYREMQRELHKSPGYGTASFKRAKNVKHIFLTIQAKSISDYGAGKCRLREGLESQGLTGFEYFPYDPAFPEYGEPKPADLVCCIDVLEHIEMEFLPNVLRDLQQITTGYGFISIHTAASTRTLSDGRNAHLIQKPNSWWLSKLSDLFEIIALQALPKGFWIATKPKIVSED